MAGQFDRYRNNDYYWTLTSDGSLEVWDFDNESTVNTKRLTYTSGVRPSMNLKSNVVITGGDGTKNNPFTLALQ